ncbi:MAG TPA: SCO family protein [Candidatus Acidoferrales bacterium]|nr:SCO family protein [Candidatus Acidoferrales bacterium]
MIAAAIPILLHGIVVASDPRRRLVTVSHGAFDGMPAMTMTFGVDPHGTVQPRAGDRIVAVVDEKTQPWSIRVLSQTAAPPAPDAAPFVPLLRPGWIVPDAAFVDEHGRARSWRDFRGHAIAVSFVYTRCRDARMCPLVSAKFAAMEPLLPPGAREIEFTLDPEYDTPPVLTRYAATFGAHDPPWVLATGNAATMRAIALEFGVGATERRESAIVHGEALGIVNPDGTLHARVYGNDWQAPEVVAQVRDAEGLGSGPWERFTFWLRSGLGAAARACGAVDTDGRVRPAVLFLEGAGLAIMLLVCVALGRSLLQWRRTPGRP